MCYLRITVKKKAILIVTAYMAILQFAPPPIINQKRLLLSKTKMQPLTIQRVHCIKIGVFSHTKILTVK